jgi:hypothetical protein
MMDNYFDSQEWKNCKMPKKEDIQICSIKPRIKINISELIQAIFLKNGRKKIMFKFLKSLFIRKKNRRFVSRKEIKQLYKNMSKNQLITVINKLVHENAELKLKKQARLIK